METSLTRASRQRRNPLARAPGTTSRRRDLQPWRSRPRVDRPRLPRASESRDHPDQPRPEDCSRARSLSDPHPRPLRSPSVRPVGSDRPRSGADQVRPRCRGTRGNHQAGRTNGRAAAMPSALRRRCWTGNSPSTASMSTSRAQTLMRGDATTASAFISIPLLAFARRAGATAPS